MTTIIMLDELCAPVIQVLAMQYATRILDYHLGNYELEEGELFCSFAVKNLSLETAPFGIAFHPYFSTSWLEGKALFQSDAETSFILNENLIATGRSKTASTSKDLSVGKAVVGAKLDDGFTDLKFVNGVSSTKLISESGQGVEVWQEDIFKHLVIYTTDVLPTKQGAVSAIAIEPSTSEVNAFNSKQDLLLLSAGETRSGSWGIRLT